LPRKKDISVYVKINHTPLYLFDSKLILFDKSWDSVRLWLIFAYSVKLYLLHYCGTQPTIHFK